MSDNNAYVVGCHSHHMSLKWPVRVFGRKQDADTFARLLRRWHSRNNPVGGHCPESGKCPFDPAYDQTMGNPDVSIVAVPFVVSEDESPKRSTKK